MIDNKKDSIESREYMQQRELLEALKTQFADLEKYNQEAILDYPSTKTTDEGIDRIAQLVSHPPIVDKQENAVFLSKLFIIHTYQLLKEIGILWGKKQQRALQQSVDIANVLSPTLSSINYDTLILQIVKDSVIARLSERFEHTVGILFDLLLIFYEIEKHTAELKFASSFLELLLHKSCSSPNVIALFNVVFEIEINFSQTIEALFYNPRLVALLRDKNKAPMSLRFIVIFQLFNIKYYSDPKKLLELFQLCLRNVTEIPKSLFLGELALCCRAIIELLSSFQITISDSVQKELQTSIKEAFSVLLQPESFSNFFLVDFLDLIGKMHQLLNKEIYIPSCIEIIEETLKEKNYDKLICVEFIACLKILGMPHSERFCYLLLSVTNKCFIKELEKKEVILNEILENFIYLLTSCKQFYSLLLEQITISVSNPKLFGGLVQLLNLMFNKKYSKFPDIYEILLQTPHNLIYPLSIICATDPSKSFRRIHLLENFILSSSRECKKYQIKQFSEILSELNRNASKNYEIFFLSFFNDFLISFDKYEDRTHYFPHRYWEYLEDCLSKGNKINCFLFFNSLKIVVKHLQNSTDSIVHHSLIISHLPQLLNIIQVQQWELGCENQIHPCTLLICFLELIKTINNEAVSRSSIFKHKKLIQLLKAWLNLPEESGFLKRLPIICEALFDSILSVSLSLAKFHKEKISHSFFLQTYFSFLKKLAKLKNTSDLAQYYLLKFFKSINYSYTNLLALSKNPFWRVTQLIDNPEIKKEAIKLITEVATVSINSEHFGSLMRGIAERPIIMPQLTGLFVGVAPQLVELLDRKEQKVESCTLLETGYCFFGWVRVEIPEDNAQKYAISVLALEASDTAYIEFQIKDGYFWFSNSVSSPVQLTTSPIEFEKWIFFEFYHINCHSESNVQLYLNRELVQPQAHDEYLKVLTYSHNTVGNSPKNCPHYSLYDIQVSALSIVGLPEASERSAQRLHSVLRITSSSIPCEVLPILHKQDELSWKNWIQINGIVLQKDLEPFSHPLLKFLPRRRFVNFRELLLNKGGLIIVFALLYKLSEGNIIATDSEVEIVLDCALEWIHCLLLQNRPKCLVVLKEARTFWTFRHILFRFKKYLGVDVYCKIRKICHVFQQFYPEFLEDLLNNIVLNMELWAESDDETHKICFEVLQDQLDGDTSGNIFDIGLGCLKILSKSNVKVTPMFTKAMCKRIVDHPSLETHTMLINYLNPNKNFSILNSYCFMQIYAKLFSHCRSWVEKVAGEEIKLYGFSRTLPVLFQLLYISVISLNREKKNFLEHDFVISKCLLILSKYNYKIVKDSIKSIQSQLTQVNTPIEQFLLYFNRLLNKGNGISEIEHTIVTILFSEAEEGLLGTQTLTALLALSFYYVGKERKVITKSHSLNTIFYQEILLNFHTFTSAAQDKFLESGVRSQDPSFLKHLFSTKTSINLLLGLARCCMSCRENTVTSPALFTNILLFVLEKSQNLDEACEFFDILLFDLSIGVKKLCHFMNALAEKVRKTPQKSPVVLLYLKIAYILEDIFELNTEMIVKTEEIFLILAQFLLILDNCNLLYFSLPKFIVNDSFKLDKIRSRFETREGGIVRIILKIMLYLLKYSSNYFSVILFHHYIFRDSRKELKDFIKKYGKLIGKREYPKTAHYCLMDLCIASNKKIIKIHAGITDTFRKPVEDIKFSVLGTRSSTKGGNSIFETHCFTLYFLLAELLHLITQKEQSMELLGAHLSLVKDIVIWGGEQIVAKAMERATDNLIKLQQFECNGPIRIYSALNREGIEVDVSKADLRISLATIVGIAEIVNSEIKLEDKCQGILKIIRSPYYEKEIQPVLLAFTSNCFYVIDQVITSKLKIQESPIHIPSLQIPIDFIEHFSQCTKQLPIHISKIIRDYLNENIHDVSALDYEKLVEKFLKNKTEKKTREQYNYIQRQYLQYIKRCPLYQQQLQQHRNQMSPFNKLIGLDLHRDNLGRAMRLKSYDKVIQKNTNVYVLKYLKLCYIKKLLLLYLAKCTDKNIALSDFKFPVMQHLFQMTDRSSLRKQSIIPWNDNISEITELTSSFHSSFTVQETEVASSDFECEKIGIKGAVFGLLHVNDIFLSFHNSPRQEGKKYQYGARTINKITKKISKIWVLNNIKEIVIRRFNLIRQGVEIYFSNHKSVFLIFFNKENKNLFMKKISYICSKNLDLKIRLVSNPEEFFAKSKYIERWVNGRISNFKYLYILNKYGSRTFNDLNQYPIFPWILSEYSGESLDIYKNPSIYRELCFPIAGITLKKQRNADDKLNALIRDEGLKSFQFGTHYLPGRSVLGYLLRVEPFASLLIEYENGQETANRMFHVIAQSWSNVCNDSCDNQELIPEFFYNPYIFQNLNCYSFGKKTNYNDLVEGVKKETPLIVDQVILPPYAENSHHFIAIQSLALESLYVSSSLHNWIDLIFGIKQQDPQVHNLFPALCDEGTIARKLKKLNGFELDQIQEFGNNPIRLFNFSHPKRSLDMQALILFSQPEQRYSVVKIDEIGKRVQKIIPLKDQVLLQTDVLQISKFGIVYNRACILDCTMINLQNDKTELIKSICVTTGGTLAVGEYKDTSLRLFNLGEKKLIQKIYFHESKITSLTYVPETHLLFCGAESGLITGWELSKNKMLENYPRIMNADLDSAILVLDASHELDLLAAGSSQGKICLYYLSSNKLFLDIFPEFDEEESSLLHIKLLFSGYLALVYRASTHDILVIYSINGELITKTVVMSRIHAILSDQSGYQLIIGGDKGTLQLFNIFTLSPSNIVSSVFTKSSITALAFENQGVEQHLLVGTSAGELFSLFCSAAESKS